MQVLRDELEKISDKYGYQELYVEGFTPEQIYYQIEDLCNSIVERSDVAISRLYPKYQKLSLQNDGKVCCGKSSEDSQKETIADQDEEIPPESIEIEKCSSVGRLHKDESLGSSSFDSSENDVFQMPASETFRLLESNAENASGHSSSGSEPFSEDDDQ
ncbi:hypothetical protein EROM_010100 [Encephalitozoon romaleae SJ-2008]|uniref:Uncharacterized protein n=1 Tax=Encephalitozoon romaleae (strain SJ-2008) TaxID=1178016 RepID=I7ACP9_ENCRO|nr:hypothetical protein EROM_010100 [Encephalitozoon romaleae SJ-2008]AFN82355.1 hypothetical protein EROM_010100 [Encephalitozoon romaleae SJ-2008]